MFVFLKILIKKAGIKYKSTSFLPVISVVFVPVVMSSGRMVDLLDEILMQMVICGQFRVEGGGELMPLSNRNDVSVHLRQNFHFRGKDAMDVGCTDEGHGQMIGNARYFACSVETA